MSQIATLISNPSNPAVSAELAGAIAAVFGSAPIYWLADNIACDIVLEANSDPATSKAAIEDIIGTQPVDIVIQEQDTRRKKALIADMDSTMIEQECIDELAAEAGLKDRIAKITARAMNGEIPFEPALKERVALLKGLPVSIIERVIENRITLTSGGRQLVATMNANGAHTALVSGGFSHFTNHVARLLGFAENRANVLIEHENKLTGEVVRPILGRQAKVDVLNEIAAAHSLDNSEFMAVGDGANDLGMLGAAGCGVALHAKPVVAQQAEIRIDHGDLSALLYIQGYRKRDFIS